jgi:hypothetical protein
MMGALLSHYEIVPISVFGIALPVQQATVYPLPCGLMDGDVCHSRAVCSITTEFFGQAPQTFFTSSST